MRYLSVKEILIIHALIIDETGGRHGVRDEGLLASASERPKTMVFGQEQFPSIFLKAAAYLDSIAKHHVFVDGNKRSAVSVAARFLHANGFVLRATNAALEKFAVEVVTKRLDIEAIASWLNKQSKKNP
ncbi:MAG: type II toxin-antitoxin system death-on-curing family toxin [Patescibacteria group bacterium]